MTLITTLCSFAQSFEYEGIWYRVISTEDKTVSVIANDNYKTYSGDIIIPSVVKYNGQEYSVTMIGGGSRNNAFTNCTSVTIPESVTTIGENAFYGCSNLTSLFIPKSVTDIYFINPFAGCANLSSITVDPTNPKYDSRSNCNAIIDTQKAELVVGCINTVIPEDIKQIGRDAFMGLTYLKSIDIPDGVTHIRHDAFRNCIGLKSIRIPESVTYIGDGAFSYCEEASISIYSNITYIGKEAFVNCRQLSSFVIPNGTTTTIGSRAFAGCSGAIIDIHSSVTFEGYTENSSGEFAFWGCSGLKSITIAEGVTNIGNCTFAGCSGLTSLTIPESVEIIQDGAFMDCSSLTEINLPDSLKILGDYFVTSTGGTFRGGVFEGCSSLKSIKIPSKITHLGTRAFYGCSSLSTIGNFENILSIGHEAFRDCSSLTAIALPDGYRRIDSYMFYGCSGLKSITIPDGIIDIGEYAFAGCSGLSSLNIPASVLNIGHSAFLDCSGLTTITVDTANTSYDSRDNCNAIIVSDNRAGGYSDSYYLSELHKDYLILGCKNTTIPSTVTTIDRDAFYGCSGLTSITIPESVTKISDGAFYGCSGLKSVSIPNSVVSIEDKAFWHCKELESIYIPALTTSIGNCFNYTNLKSIAVDPGNIAYDSRDNCNAIIASSTDKLIAGCGNTIIPESVTTIGLMAFAGCTGLDKVVIPESVSIIEIGAFYASDIKSVTIPESVISFGTRGTGTFNHYNTYYDYGVFRDCSSLQSVVFKMKLSSRQDSIGAYAFYNCASIDSFVIYIGKDEPWRVIELEGCYIGKSAFTLDPSSASAVETSTLYVPKGCYQLYRDLYYNRYNNEGPLFGQFANIREMLGDDFKTVDGINYQVNTSNGDKYASVAYGYYEGSIVIPPSVVIDGMEYSVKEIGEMAFLGCRKITSVSLPNTLTTLGAGSFNDCSGLTSISLPSGLITIGNSAFEGCSSLSSVVIPERVTAIGWGAFSGCTRLKSIELPSGITSIGAKTFSGCSSLEAIDIPSGVTAIGWGAFSGCIRLKSIELPSGITSIGAENFSGCSSLEAIDIPSGVTYIGGYAFFDCCNITSIVIPSGVTNINNGLLSGCSKLKTVTIPAKVDSIFRGAFSGCSSLESINIPAGAKYIGDYAFSGCSSLTNITIPSGIDFVAPHLMENCSKLTSINIPSRVDSIGEYAFAGCSSLKSMIVPDGVTTIYFSSFYNCNSLSFLSIPSSVTLFSRSEDNRYYSSGDIYKNFLFDHFEGCDALQTAGPKGGGYNYEFDWDTIPANAFRGLNNLRSVYIPKTVKAVYECDYPSGKYDFQPGPDFNSVYYIRTSSSDLPTYEVGYIGLVFDGCDKLESITVSFKDTRLMRLWRDQNAPEPEPYRYDGMVNYTYKESPMDFNLYKFNSVKSITILDDTIHSLKSILTESIKEIVISEYVNKIDSGVFRFVPYSTTAERYYLLDGRLPRLREFAMAQKLESITVKSTNTHYSSVDGVLLNKNGSCLILCPGNRKSGYLIPETVVEVANASFQDCKGLSFVRIPASVERVGENAFDGCQSIEWISFEGAPQIGKNAFKGCNDIQSITAHSTIPGVIELLDVPQTIIAGEYENFYISTDRNLHITPLANDELGRTVTEIYYSSRPSWSCSIDAGNIPVGKYKMSIGVLPNSDDKPSYFHPAMYGLTDSSEVVIFNPINKQSFRKTPIYYSNDPSGYDSVAIADTLVIPSEYKGIRIDLISGVNSSNSREYSSRLLLDRIFFEPIGNDFPQESYCGPFTESVFNNATLYVPEDAISAYREADGWKLFNNIAIDTAVEPVYQSRDTKQGCTQIYDITGRKVMATDIKELQPGLYIINGKKYLKSHM